MEKLKKSGSINGNVCNGGISEKQLNWLQEQLKSRDKSNLKSILFCHFPIFPKTKYNLLNDMEVISVISQYKNVILWICGHDHDGNYGKINNCHVVNLKGLVETERKNAFSIFEINNNRININGFGREVDRLLEI